MNKQKQTASFIKGSGFLLLIIISTLLFCFLVGIDFSPFIRGPAPYPPDWRWPYLFVNNLSKIYLPLSAALLLLIFFFFILKKKEEDIALREKKYLFFLILLFFLFQLSVIYYSRAGIGVLLGRIISPGVNGYFSTALIPQNLFSFLSGFEKNVSSYPMYARFHPPGSVLIFSLLIELSKIFSPYLGFLSGISLSHADIQSLWLALNPPQRLAALISGFFIPFLSCLTVIPLYYTGRLLSSPKTSMTVSFLYCLLPASTLFIPLNDAFFPFLFASSLYFFVKGLKNSGKIFFFCSGLLFFLGSFFTLTILPLGLSFAVLLLYEFSKNRNLSKLFLNSSLFLSGFFLPLLLLFFFKFNSFTALGTILHNHYQVVSLRKNPLWIFYDYYDFFIFLGFPLSVVFLRYLVQVLKSRKLPDPLFLSFCLITLFIVLSGSANGETGRVWLPFTVLILFPLVNFLSQKKVFSSKFILILCFFQVLELLVLQAFWVTVW